MMGLTQLHTLVRAQVRAGDSQPMHQADMAPGEMPSPSEQRILATWRRARATASSAGARPHPSVDSDEWTVRTPERR